MGQLIGVLLLWLGGLSSASFYAPVHRIRQWAWATYWITLGFVAWMILPSLGAMIVSHGKLLDILSASPGTSLFYAYLFGVLWGFGGLMAALALRYLGLGLGNSICLGVCAIFGTLVPAVINHKMQMLLTTTPGLVIISGLGVCLLGIILCGWAGFLKEKSLANTDPTEKKDEFALGKGLFMGIFGGVMSSFMAIAFMAGEPIAKAAIASGTADVFKNIPILVLSLSGGFTTNFIYALIVSFRNKSLGDWFLKNRGILAMNFFWSMISGIMWYAQYFFYGIGTTQMGQYDFASWSIFMSSIVICANLWGLALHEWQRTNVKTRIVLWCGIVVLIASICLIGLGNYLDIR